MSKSWSRANLAHAMVVYYTNSYYGDDILGIANNPDKKNSDLSYYNNTATSNQNRENASIFAGGLIVYIEQRGVAVSYHDGKDRIGLYNSLVAHLQNPDALFIDTAYIADEYIKFFGEME